jgi:hypothetical protein
MFTFERVSGLFVIKRPDIPLNELEVLAIVLGVAADTAIARSRLNAVGGMQSCSRINPRGNFGMAIQTLEGCLPG